MRRLAGDYRASEAYESALAIFRDLGDRAWARPTLSAAWPSVWLHNGEYRGATEALETALDTYRAFGDRRGEANALGNLRIVRLLAPGDPCGPGEEAETVLAIFRILVIGWARPTRRASWALCAARLGHYRRAAQFRRQHCICTVISVVILAGQANVLCELGIVRRQAGDYQGAAEVLAEALGVYRDHGDRAAEAETLNDIGALQLAGSEPDAAQASHRQALILARHLDLDSSFDEAQALAGLARCDLAAGRTDDARRGFRHALGIFPPDGCGRSKRHFRRAARSPRSTPRARAADGGPGSPRPSLACLPCSPVCVRGTWLCRSSPVRLPRRPCQSPPRQSRSGPQPNRPQ